MDSVTIDGLDEHEFRRSIENMLRHGEADGAASKLRALLEPYAGPGGILPPRFLTVSPGDVALAGWDTLGQRIGQYDRPHHEISAVSVAVTHPEDCGIAPDAAGKLAPCIETAYYSDEAYPFSEAAREDLLEGYSLYGCQWDGDYENSDSTLSVEGLDDLYGAIAQLEARLLDDPEPGADDIRAGSLGACYLAVLVHQAVRDSIRKHGLPRPMCVMAGNNGVYPFFDAPVISSDEYVDSSDVKPVVSAPAQDPFEAEDSPAAEAAERSSYDSLLSLNIRKGTKKPVLMLESGEAEADARVNELDAMHRLAGTQTQPEAAPPVQFDTFDPPEPPAPAEPAAPASVFDHYRAAPSRIVFDPPEPAAPAAPFERVAQSELPEPAEPAAEFTEPGAPEPYAPESHEPEPYEPELPTAPVVEPEFDPLPLAAQPEAIEEPAPAADFDQPAEPIFPREMPGGVEWPERVEETPAPVEAEPAPQPRARPIPAPAGHSLRARIASTHEPEQTFMERVAAFLRRLGLIR